MAGCFALFLVNIAFACLVSIDGQLSVKNGVAYLDLPAGKLKLGRGAWKAETVKKDHKVVYKVTHTSDPSDPVQYFPAAKGTSTGTVLMVSKFASLRINRAPNFPDFDEDDLQALRWALYSKFLQPRSLRRPLSQPLPSSQPFPQPSSQPFPQPSSPPFLQPNSQPFPQPSSQPFLQPSSQPFLQPNSQPFSQPNSQPFLQPNFLPFPQQSLEPFLQPNFPPFPKQSFQPFPSAGPYRQPNPFTQPSLQPSNPQFSQQSLQPFLQTSSNPKTQPQPFYQAFLQPNFLQFPKPSFFPQSLVRTS